MKSRTRLDTTTPTASDMLPHRPSSMGPPHGKWSNAPAYTPTRRVVQRKMQEHP